ncbi:hypothetical protein [Streptomyces xiamenensis]|uniref:hypothetical protein n=1 Tax=Streptomyces xiamenensis TaxID=408015 RepID=UPI003D726277
MITTRTQLADLTQDQLDWLYDEITILQRNVALLHDGINQAAREALAQRREMRQITRQLATARAYATDNAVQLAQSGHTDLLLTLGIHRRTEGGQQYTAEILHAAVTGAPASEH